MKRSALDNFEGESKMQGIYRTINSNEHDADMVYMKHTEINDWRGNESIRKHQGAPSPGSQDGTIMRRASGKQTQHTLTKPIARSSPRVDQENVQPCLFDPSQRHTFLPPNLFNQAGTAWMHYSLQRRLSLLANGKVVLDIDECPGL